MKVSQVLKFHVFSCVSLACSLFFFVGVSQAAFIDTSPASNSGFSGSGFGNTYTSSATDADGDLVTLTISAHSLSGNSFVDSQLRSFSAGLGVCNPSEGTNCPGGPHTIDNVSNGPDFILLQWDKAVTQASVTLGAFGDTDAMYFFGTGAPDFSFLANNLGTATTSAGGNASRTVTLNMPGITSPIDWVLFGASVGNPDGINDRFKLAGVSFETPIPPVAVLFGTGLVGLIGLARRKIGLK